MKKLYVVLTILACSSYSLEPLAIFWRIDKANLYYEDWNSKGYPKEKRDALLNRIPKRLGTMKAPYDVALKNIGGAGTSKKIKIFQAAVSIQYKENSSKDHEQQIIWIGKNCELEVFENSKSKQDSLIYWIKMAAPKEAKEKIFASKACKDILSKFGI